MHISFILVFPILFFIYSFYNMLLVVGMQWGWASESIEETASLVIHKFECSEKEKEKG